MMTQEEFFYLIAAEDKKAKGCICFECLSCDWSVFWYEGDLKTCYIRYKRGCPKCGGKIRFYGTKAEL